MATDNQKLVVKKTLETLGNNKIVNRGKILRESGYSKNTSLTPQTIYESVGVRKAFKSVIDKMINRRDKAIDKITDIKLDNSNAKDLTDIVDKFTKNIQLLSGKPTERTKMEISEQEKKETDVVVDNL